MLPELNGTALLVKGLISWTCAEGKPKLLLGSDNSNLVSETLSGSKYTLILLFVFFLYTVRGRLLVQRRITANGKIILNRVLPRAQWQFLNLGILDGLIALADIKRDGMRIFDKSTITYGATFKAQLGMQEVVVTSDVGIIKKVLSSNNNGHLTKPKLIYEMFSEFLNDGLLVADVTIWRGHRAAISPALTYHSYPTYMTYIDNGARALATSACLSAAAGKGIVNAQQMKSLMDVHFTKITTEIIMGAETFSILENERVEFYNAVARLKELLIYRFHHAELMIPFIWKFHAKKREMDKLHMVLRQFSYKIINEYRAKGERLEVEPQINVSGTDTQSAKRLVDELVVNMTKGNTKNASPGRKPFECLIEKMIKAGYCNREIADEIITFLIGGNDTGVTALNFIFFHLAGNAEHQRKCQMEIDELVKESGALQNEAMTLEQLAKLKYLERCILESLRLTPPIPALMRYLDTPIDTDGDSILEAGTTVLILPWAVHRKPEIYPNPEHFDPDRFLPENVKDRHSHAFLPFSMGARNCIGWKIAMMELKVVTAYILRRFDLSTSDLPGDVKLLFGITLQPERPYNVEFKLRKL